MLNLVSPGAGATQGGAGQADGGTASSFRGQRLEFPLQTVAPGEVRLAIQVHLPPGYKPAPESPAEAKVTTADTGVLSQGPEPSRTVSPAQFPLELPLTARPGETRLTVDLVLYYCKAQDGFCLLKEVRLILPVKVAAGAQSHRLEAAYRLVGP